LRRLCEGVAASYTELGTGFLISHPAVSTMPTDCSTLEHLEEAIAAVNNGPLSVAVLRKIE
jgi:aryl-alcohol dehydrogenase-like predicted oxidoreductase